MAYAEGTAIAVEKSIAEIIALVKRAGAERVAQYEEPERFTIQFEMCKRLIRFRVLLPTIETIAQRDGSGRYRTDQLRANLRDQRHRQRARALLLVIKAKLESVESDVETFEEAFLPNVVMANGQTVYERIVEPIAIEYQSGEVRPMLLEGPR